MLVSAGTASSADEQSEWAQILNTVVTKMVSGSCGLPPLIFYDTWQVTLLLPVEPAASLDCDHMSLMW